MKLGDLRTICFANDSESKSACKFFVYGVAEGSSLGAAMSLKTKTHFCLPEGVGADYMVKIVKEDMAKDLAAFPEDKNLAAVGFIASVIDMHYPCSTH